MIKKREKTRLELKAEAIAACANGQGNITPSAVIKAAQDPDNILHGEFEWDLEKAAHAHWEQRARELIREVKFVVEYDEIRRVVPFYVSDPRDAVSSYSPTAKIAKSSAAKSQVLRDELARIRSAICRASDLAAVFGLSSTFEKMLEDIIEMEARLPLTEEAGDLVQQ